MTVVCDKASGAKPNTTNMARAAKSHFRSGASDGVKLRGVKREGLAFIIVGSGWGKKRVKFVPD